MIGLKEAIDWYTIRLLGQPFPYRLESGKVVVAYKYKAEIYYDTP